MILSLFQDAKADCWEGENCGFWSGTSSKVVTLDDFPNCEVTVYYRTRECDGMLQIDFVSMSFVIYPGDDCDALFEYLVPGGMGSYANSINMSKVYAEAFDKLHSEFFMDAYEWAKVDPWTDQTQYECPNSYTLKTSFDGACVTWGYAIKVFHNYWEFRFESAACQENACCIIEYDMCYNTSTGTIEETRRISEDPAQDCPSETPPVLFPDLQGDPSWYIFQTPCEEACWLIFSGN
jgi:hypothetical protein